MLTGLCVATHRRKANANAASGHAIKCSFLQNMNAVEAAKMFAELPAGTVSDFQAGDHVGIVWPPGSPKTTLGEPGGRMTVGRLVATLLSVDQRLAVVVQNRADSPDATRIAEAAEVVAANVTNSPVRGDYEIRDDGELSVFIIS